MKIRSISRPCGFDIGRLIFLGNLIFPVRYRHIFRSTYTYGLHREKSNSSDVYYKRQSTPVSFLFVLGVNEHFAWRFPVCRSKDRSIRGSFIEEEFRDRIYERTGTDQRVRQCATTPTPRISFGCNHIYHLSGRKTIGFAGELGDT